MRITIEERICPDCGESSEKKYETVFVHGQELCVCCNSNIEPCYEGVKDNVFVDIFHELHLSYNPLLEHYSLQALNHSPIVLYL